MGCFAALKLKYCCEYYLMPINGVIRCDSFEQFDFGNTMSKMHFNVKDVA